MTKKEQQQPPKKYYQPWYRDKHPEKGAPAAPFGSQEEMDEYCRAQGGRVIHESWLRSFVASATTLVPCSHCKIPLPTSGAAVAFPSYNWTTSTLDCWDYYHEPCWLMTDHMNPRNYRYVLPRNWVTEKIFRSHEDAGEDMGDSGLLKGPELDIEVPETTETGEFIAD